MIATVYESTRELYLKDSCECPEIDLANLYEEFVERKLHIYLTEKQNADITNPTVQHNNKRLKNYFLNEFEKCALVVILPPTELESLHDKKIQEDIKPFLDMVQDGEHKTGIV
jgi:hypothetical protein